MSKGGIGKAWYEGQNMSRTDLAQAVRAGQRPNSDLDCSGLGMAAVA